MKTLPEGMLVLVASEGFQLEEGRAFTLAELDQYKAAIKEARREALEEAAELCENYETAHYAAQDLRALAEKDEQ